MGADLRHALVRSWNRRGLLAVLLWPAAALYGTLTALHRYLYRVGALTIEKAAVPVIVVGNVVAGGAGKTPVVMAVVAHLRSRGFKPGVVSRGYGRRDRQCREVLSTSTATDVGDEPILIRHATGVPVCVAAQRVDAARLLLQRHPEVDVLVCDDGLQHYGLQRDIEICVFDERGIGNGMLLPAGPLREPWPRPTDLVLAPTGTELFASAFQMKRTLSDEARRSDGTRVALASLVSFRNRADARLVAVAGIARPEVFFAALRLIGLPLASTMALPDHARFDGPQWSAPDGNTLLCTEKDAVKLWRHRPAALAVPLVLQLEPAFWNALDQRLRAVTGAKL